MHVKLYHIPRPMVYHCYVCNLPVYYSNCYQQGLLLSKKKVCIIRIKCIHPSSILYMCLIGIDFASFYYIFCWILELFQQCSIFLISFDCIIKKDEVFYRTMFLVSTLSLLDLAVSLICQEELRFSNKVTMMQTTIYDKRVSDDYYVRDNNKKDLPWIQIN
jgi:hypothetical protein